MSTLSVSNITGNPTSSLGQITSTSNTATFGTSVYFVANGNVGIGTNNPTSASLHIASSSNPGIRIQTTGVQGNWIDFVSNSGAVVGNIYYDPTNYMDFGVSNTSGNRNVSIRLDGNGNFNFNSGYGSVATAFGCRAWVNFNGTGVVAIRGSGNITSITDNGTGDYTVNFTNAMPDGNYTVTSVAQRNVTNSGMFLGIKQGTTPSTTQCVIATPNNAGTLEDSSIACVAFFR